MLDVRTPGEFDEFHVAGAQLLPLQELDAACFLEARGENKDPLYVFCLHGHRASKAIQKFRQAGFEGCVLVEGGMAAWVEAGLPVEKG